MYVCVRVHVRVSVYACVCACVRVHKLMCVYECTCIKVGQYYHLTSQY